MTVLMLTTVEWCTVLVCVSGLVFLAGFTAGFRLARAEHEDRGHSLIRVLIMAAALRGDGTTLPLIPTLRAVAKTHGIPDPTREASTHE